MSTAMTACLTTPRRPQVVTPLARAATISGIVAAAATTATAAVVHGAGVPLDAHGPIPLLAFGQMTFLGAIIGGLIAAVIRRRCKAPARRLVQVTTALVGLSAVPSMALGSHLATKLTLIALHVFAAAIIVPVLAHQLDR